MDGAARLRIFFAGLHHRSHRFRESVKRACGRLEPLELEAKGPRGERLTIDIAWFGSEKPKRVFVHSSGLLGVEAFAGSAIQLQWLKQGIPLLQASRSYLCTSSTRTGWHGFGGSTKIMWT